LPSASPPAACSIDVPDFSGVARLIDEAGAARAFPAATIEVGTAARPLWQHAVGRLTYDADAAATTPDTVFDLASLTKVIATTPLVMRLVERRRLLLDTPIRRLVPAWTAADRVEVALLDLLEHSAGLTAWWPLYKHARSMVEFTHLIAELPLEYKPRTRSVYSDLGFILLGGIVAERGRAPLDAQFADVLGDTGLTFRPDPSVRAQVAPTEIDVEWRGRLIVGEVHDENAWALSGVAGHAGLFGTAAAVGRFAQLLLQARRGPGRLGPPWLLKRFLHRSVVPGSSRALGWDTMLPTSSCGTRMSAAAVGHTGFTGTSLWIDPVRDLYVVLLTNRVYPTRPADRRDALARLRPAVHDAVVSALLAAGRQSRAGVE
jgi:CubicO group peptidase (beta-lactamase class C family)